LGVDFRRQEGLLLCCERGQEGVEIDRRRPAVDLRLRAEPERTTDLCCFGAELVGLGWRRGASRRR